MWTCRNCNKERPHAWWTPEIDDIGVHFICPDCGHRNILVAMREDDEDEGSSTLLMQPDLDWPSGKPWRK